MQPISWLGLYFKISRKRVNTCRPTPWASFLQTTQPITNKNLTFRLGLGVRTKFTTVFKYLT